MVNVISFRKYILLKQATRDTIELDIATEAPTHSRVGFSRANSQHSLGSILLEYLYSRGFYANS